MLTRLFIQNLATIEKQVVEFSPGFTALTGETGAGKSVMIKALRLILGEKCPKDLIRTGQNFLSVEAVFTISDIQPIRELLDEMEIEYDDELVIRRKVHQSGKNTILLNDYTSNLAKLALFGNYLADLHGQHSQQSLLSSSTHVTYLDAFAGIQEEVTGFESKYRLLNQLLDEKRDLAQSAANRNKEIDFLKFQINEIEQAGFTEEEEVGLYEEAKVLSNSEQLIAALSPVAAWQDGDGGVLSEIAASLHSMEKAIQLDSSLEHLYKEFKTSVISLEETASEVNGYLSKLEINPLKLEDVNKRIAELDDLKRKYGATLNDIFSYKVAKQEALSKLENLEVSFGSLDEKISTLKSELLNYAGKISEQREDAKKRFEKVIAENLSELGMERSTFEIELQKIQPNEQTNLPFNSKGSEQVEFKIATNPGTPTRSLAKIASGGELSRIMLAIKTSLNIDISFGSMVFDEVDSGISGRVAETVGFKLSNLGKSRQIICITHSPQIASKADEHYKVRKILENESSKTFVDKLKPDERVEEIAQFLGGNEISDKTRSAAKEMLTQPN